MQCDTGRSNGTGKARRSFCVGLLSHRSLRLRVATLTISGDARLRNGRDVRHIRRARHIRHAASHSSPKDRPSRNLDAKRSRTNTSPGLSRPSHTSNSAGRRMCKDRARPRRDRAEGRPGKERERLDSRAPLDMGLAADRAPHIARWRAPPTRIGRREAPQRKERYDRLA
jgi:hypothetical protein